MKKSIAAAPTVKAFEYQNTILVKYYESGGGASSLNCPLCHWFGEIELATTEHFSGYSEFRCPHCNTKLARASFQHH